MKSLQRVSLQTLKGQPVKLLKTLRNGGGEVFEAGTIMYIADKYRGWGLSRIKGSLYDISRVDERYFELCLTPDAADLGVGSASDDQSTTAPSG